MINEKMLKELNSQTNEEMYSSYLYLSMSNHFDSSGLKGFSHWMRVQAREELVHAIKYQDYILERGSNVSLTEIRKPDSSWKSPLHVFESALKHEQYVSSLINSLLDTAIETKDHASNAFLQWFINEQVEEEATASDIVGKLKIANNEGNAILLIDKDLHLRVFVDPTV